MNAGPATAPDPNVGELHYHDDEGRWMALPMPNEHAILLARIHAAAGSDRPIFVTRELLTEALEYLSFRASGIAAP